METSLMSSFNSLPAAITNLEQVNGGRLGVAVLDTGTGERAGHRQNERFPMCSTFKFLLVWTVMQRVDRQQETLDRALKVPPKPLLFNSPLTAPHAGRTMTIAALCHAALTRSDNTATNLLLESIGGPTGVTAFSRSIGDEVTRLDRLETALNECLEGDPRDTTSPASMVDNLNSVLLENVLSALSREQLTRWMEGSLSGVERLHAELPIGWRAVDKTGSNLAHTSNDIAVIWPTGRPPVIIAAYITQCFGPESKRSAILAEIGRLVAEALA